MKEATEEKDLSTKVQAEEAELDPLLEALEQKEQKPSLSSGTANQSYERSLKIMEINNASYEIRLPLRTVEVSCHTKPEARKRHSRSHLYSHNASSNFHDDELQNKDSKISHDRHNSTDSEDNNTNNGENGSTSIQPTKINKKCRYGSNCYKLAKGTYPYRHPEVVAHVAQIDDNNNGYTFDGYTYYDYSEREQ